MTTSGSEVFRLKPVSLKAFKGKGEAIRLIADLKVMLEAVWTDMAQIRDATRLMPGRQFYLYLHEIGGASEGNKYLALRWRMIGGRHVKWEKIVADVNKLPGQMREWYEQANYSSLVMNTQERLLRSEIRILEDFLRDTNSLEAVQSNTSLCHA